MPLKIENRIKTPNDQPLKDVLTIDYTKLVPVLTSAIQQQQAIIDELKQENISIKERLLAIEEHLNTPVPVRE